jgi:ABC-type transporter Mla subunit MlaD
MPTRPVAIDIHADEDSDSELEAFDPSGSGVSRPPRSRQELIAELQRNYQEVLGIVRRVGQHLDDQGDRSRRLAEIAERLPRAADDLAAVRERQDQAVQAMDALATALTRRDDRLNEGQLAQLERLDEIRGLMAESSQAERELIGSLLEFRGVMSGMSNATERLSEAVGRIEQREAERSGQFLKALEATRAWMITIAVVGGVCALVAIALGIASIG